MPTRSDTRSDLANQIPYGFLATRTWLLEQGVGPHSLDNFLKSGQLVAMVSGVYRRPDTSLKWQGVVASLQRMGSDLVVGGLTALEQQGFGHYLALSGSRTIHLYGQDPLPTWINRLSLGEIFVRHSAANLTRLKSGGAADDFTLDIPWGDGTWSLRASTPERAILELLSEVPGKVSFEHAEQLMEGLATLSPRRLDALLQRTTSIKVKRLFFWLADRQKHAWRARLDAAAYDLGSGKRVLAEGGRLDRRYLITVPKEQRE
jgi:Transcriptional regulator, AbiEi antitoxin, Type IV TA system/Transcriptional regulator, AbiEi antitoxin N-terminal domain